MGQMLMRASARSRAVLILHGDICEAGLSVRTVRCENSATVVHFIKLGWRDLFNDRVGRCTLPLELWIRTGSAAGVVTLLPPFLISNGTGL